MHQWIAAGILAASSRYVPVPFLDDLMIERCRKFVVSKTLAAHGIDSQLNQYESYYTDSTGWLSGCLTAIVKAPIKLLLFPFRKIISVLTVVRSIPKEITKTVLLGRTLDRCLARGDEIDSRRAKQMKDAFDSSFRRMDFRAVTAAVRDALSHIDHWKKAAQSDVKSTAKSELPPSELKTSAKVESSADEVQQALDRPDILELFAEFDKRFDAALLG